MAKINVADVLNKSDGHDRLAGNMTYDAKVVESVVKDSKFGGTRLRLVFEVTTGEYQGKQTTLITTFKDKYDNCGKRLMTEILPAFVDMTKVVFIDTDGLVGGRCRIYVVDQKKSNFQKIEKVMRDSSAE